MKAIKIFVIIFVISVVLLYIAIKLYDRFQRRQAALINPDITIAFEIIQIRAMLLAEQDLIDKEEYKQYKAVVENKNYPLLSLESPKGHYEFLTKLGFKMPLYKLKRPVTQSYEIKFGEDYFRLVDARSMFHEGLLDEETKEIERIIEEISTRYNLEYSSGRVKHPEDEQKQ
ncbi:MAG: hypothetical protein ACYSWZ_23360 [Planctomycetota bacterium]|jgi:hypothetical protein